MKKLLILFAAALLLQACTSKKTETTGSADSVMTESSSSVATEPAPSSLAFSQVAGYAVLNTVALSDTVNSFLIGSQEEFDKMFAQDKSQTAATKPDFLINYVIGVACLPTDRATTILMEKAEVGDAINIYLTIQRGEKQNVTYKPTQVFSVEKRGGVVSLQVFVNGKKGAEFILGG